MRFLTWMVVSTFTVPWCSAGAAIDPAGEARLVGYEKQLAEAKDEGERFALLDGAAYAALEAREMDKARSYANEALDLAPKYRESWNYGNAIHHGHLILGRVALARGDAETAITKLRAAGETPGSPQLDTFGPNMALAKALLEQGQRAPILTYLEQCRRFWSMENGQLNKWKAEILGGNVPDFGANLVYGSGPPG